jgi:hypothetical protein
MKRRPKMSIHYSGEKRPQSKIFSRVTPCVRFWHGHSFFFSFLFYPIRNFPFCHSRVVSYFLFHSDKNLRAGQTAAAAAAARADYPPATSAQQRYMQMLCGATNRLVCLTNKCLINVNIKLAKKGQNGKK